MRHAHYFKSLLALGILMIDLVIAVAGITITVNSGFFANDADIDGTLACNSESPNP